MKEEFNISEHLADMSDSENLAGAATVNDELDKLLASTNLTAAERAESERFRAELEAMPIEEVVKLVRGPIFVASGHKGES